MMWFGSNMMGRQNFGGQRYGNSQQRFGGGDQGYMAPWGFGGGWNQNPYSMGWGGGYGGYQQPSYGGGFGGWGSIFGGGRSAYSPGWGFGGGMNYQQPYNPSPWQYNQGIYGGNQQSPQNMQLLDPTPNINDPSTYSPSFGNNFGSPTFNRGLANTIIPDTAYSPWKGLGFNKPTDY